MSPALTMFEVTPDHPVPISPQGGTASVTVLSGDTLYYADTPQVSAANNQGSVTAGNVQTFTNPAWVRSASLSTVLVQIAAPPAAALLGSDGTVGGPGGTPLAGGALFSSASVDLCRGPYNCVPGTDITTTLQNAINALVVPGAAITFYFSQPGVYNLNGAQQSGTVSGRAYSGQVILPGLVANNGAVVRFRGLSAPLWGSNHVGVTLQSNATSGNVFSVVPAGTGGSPAYSFCMPRFESLNIVCPANTQCGGLDLSNAFRAQVERIWLDGQVSDPTTLTGAGIALALPHGSNGAFSIARDFYISGFPSGLSVGDHAQIQGDAYVSYCVNALRGSNTCAANLGRLMALHCLNGIVPDGTLILEGALNWSEF